MDNINFQDYFKKYNINVSRETCNDLELFVELIIQENSLINLISRKNINKHYIMERHIVDSLQIIDFIDFNNEKIVDLGSGSGFPGIVTAIIAKHKNTSLNVELLEKSFHKSKFLKKVSEKLNLKTKIIQSDIFHEERKEKLIITSRAFKPLPVVLDLVNNKFNNCKNLIIFMGKSGEKILRDVLKKWKLIYQIKKSVTNSESFILNIREIKKL